MATDGTSMVFTKRDRRHRARDRTVSLDARTKAKMQATRRPCGECGNYTLVRNGTCMKCTPAAARAGAADLTGSGAAQPVRTRPAWAQSAADRVRLGVASPRPAARLLTSIEIGKQIS